MNIFANYITDLKFNEQQNVCYVLGEDPHLIHYLYCTVLFKLSTITNALAKILH